jgi:hypothetical protein
MVTYKSDIQYTPKTDRFDDWSDVNIYSLKFVCD